MTKTSIDSGFSGRLRSRMGKVGVGQTDLAEALGTHQSTVNSWLNGTEPRGTALYNLVDALTTTAKYLLEGEGPEEVGDGTPFDFRRINQLLQEVGHAKRKFVLRYLEAAMAAPRPKRKSAAPRPKRMRRTTKNDVGKAGREAV